ncbi:hypothetical protein CSAL01_02938 [Colletotrichum salicis]|uniref:Uncharacterized protein n=1 Tax=Colletotrichum salicis TaxID=1209931 RepID=A0A135UYQ8_9PEZI|nr:hypothetical protein CSAL01_02938 [Colletotrichum salicis]
MRSFSSIAALPLAARIVAAGQYADALPASNNEWRVCASTFTGSIQIAQDPVAIPLKSDVDFELVYDASKGVTQKVWINGAMVSQQTDVDASGKTPTYIYSSNECYQGTCGTLAGYSWSNVTVNLEKADKTFGDSLQLTDATSTGIKTTDDGKTWHFDAIKINEDYFYSDGSKKQCYIANDTPDLA